MAQTFSDRRTLWFKIGPFVGVALILVVHFFGRTLFPRPTDLPPTPFDLKGPLALLFDVAGYSFWTVALYSAWKLKSVRLDGDILTIGGLWQETTVPLHQVAEVGAPVFGRFGRIELHGDSEFGSSIWFLPTGGSEGFLAPMRSVLELRALVGQRMGDRSAALPMSVDFARSWSRLRRWSWTNRLIGVGFFLTALFVFPSHLKDPSWIVYLLPFMIGMGVTGGVISTWACPQCGQKFFTGTRALKNAPLFSQNCGHCGLKRGATAPTLPPTTR